MQPLSDADYRELLVRGQLWTRMSADADGNLHFDTIPHDQIYQRPASWFGRFMDWIMACAA